MSHRTLRILAEEDVRAAVDMPVAIEEVRRAFGQLSAGRAHVPVRTSVPSADGDALFMPGRLAGGEALGAKVVSVYPGNRERDLPPVNAAVLLLDPASGVPRAFLAANHLTALRTGAATGVATDLLARDDAKVLALFGAGTQAGTQLEAVRAVRPVKEVRVVARSLASARAFADRVEGIRALATADREAAVRGADVVVAATDSPTPVFDGESVEPGTHVNGIGSFTPEMQEVDAALVRRATVVVDDRDAAGEEAGDLIAAVREGSFRMEEIHAELGELVNGTRPGRTSPEEVTFFKSVGTAVQDLAVAGRALAEAEAKGLGREVPL